MDQALGVHVRPARRNSLLSRLIRTFVTYATIVVAFPLTLIILMELLLAIRACLITSIGLVCFAGWGLMHYGLPPLPVVCDIVSTYLKTAALGGTRFALMFAPSSIVVGVGAAVMHAAGVRWRPSHIVTHLSVADPRTSVYGGLTSVFCDVAVGSIFLPMGMYSFFGMQPGLGRGTGAAAEHPLVSLLIGVVGSAVLSVYCLVQDAASASRAKRFESALSGEKSLASSVRTSVSLSLVSFFFGFWTAVAHPKLSLALKTAGGTLKESLDLYRRTFTLAGNRQRIRIVLNPTLTSCGPGVLNAAYLPRSP